MHATQKHQSKSQAIKHFEGLFGKDSIEVAKKLLEKTLKSRPDAETTKAIRYRLKLLEPIPKNLVKCNICGKDFQARRHRYGRQKTCHECKTKRYADQAE